MVKGLDIFREYFKDFTDKYVLIGGTACNLSFQSRGLNFGRTTKDLDIVLIVEAQTEEFGMRFWDFIKAGNYKNRLKSDGKQQFYRFDKPEDERFPKMLELFSCSNCIFDNMNGIIPMHIGDYVSSLSAILLNDAYYNALLDGREIIMGVSILKPELIIPFKVKAWLDLTENEYADKLDIKKHRNDIIRLVSELDLQPYKLPKEMLDDMKKFIEQFDVTDLDLKNLKVKNLCQNDIKDKLRNIYINWNFIV